MKSPKIYGRGGWGFYLCQMLLQGDCLRQHFGDVHGSLEFALFHQSLEDTYQVHHEHHYFWTFYGPPV